MRVKRKQLADLEPELDKLKNELASAQGRRDELIGKKSAVDDQTSQLMDKILSTSK